jgi:hypothetical protein
VGESGYDGDNDVSGEEESVENTHSEDFAGDVAVTPNLAKVDDEVCADEEIVVCSYSWCFAVKLFCCLSIFYLIALLCYRI